MTWMLDALCRDRPTDWWMVPDPGNRLALAICSVCPVMARCADGDREPDGVVRAGVAWTGRGVRAPICECGQPVLGIADRCARCTVHERTPLPRRRLRRGTGDEQIDQIRSLLADGATYREAGLALRMKTDTVRKAAVRHGIRSVHSPQGSPQTGDAA